VQHNCVMLCQVFDRVQDGGSLTRPLQSRLLGTGIVTFSMSRVW
jgi:hypothetical protein